MKKNLLMLAFIMLISGCGILSTQPYIQTYYFDISSPKPSNVSKHQNIQITTITRSGPYRERMVFRTSPNSVEFDEFNRWCMPPDEMVKRYLELVYKNEADPKKEKSYSLNGNLIQLEADPNNNKVIMVIEFELYEQDVNNKIWEKTFKQQVPVQKVTGESFAKAAQFAIDNIIKDLDIYLSSSIK